MLFSRSGWGDILVVIKIITMKKALIVIGLLLIGAGCSSTDNTNSTSGIVITNNAFAGSNTNSNAESDDSDDSRVTDEVRMEGSFVNSDSTTTDASMEESTDESEDAVNEDEETTTSVESDSNVSHTPDDGWDVAVESEKEEKKYRVRVDSAEVNGEKAAVIEYAENPDSTYSVIHSFTIPGVGETTFSTSDAATSFLVIEADSYERHNYYLVDYGTRKVYPLDAAAVYYFVTGGLDGTVLTSHGQANSDGGLHLEYYGDKKVDCVVYADGVVDGSTIELEDTEVTFEAVPHDAETGDAATQTVTLDYVEECEL